MSLTTPYSDSFQVADGITTKFFFDKKFEPISKNYVKCEVYNADGSVIVPDFEPVLEEGAIKIVALTQPDGTVLNAPREGSIVRIYRDVPETQNTTVSALQASTAQQIVQNFDNIVAMIQELQYANEHFTLRSTLPQRDITIQLLRDIDDKKLIYWDNENRKLVVTDYGQDEIVLSQSVRQLKEENGKFYYYAGGEWHLLVAGETLEHEVAELNEKIDDIKQTTYTKSEVDNKITVINAEIDANADAIQKTRDDYIAADSEIHQILNNHASELATLRGNQASLGDQVSGIEEKIPESASGTNPLVTKADLGDSFVKKTGDTMTGILTIRSEEDYDPATPPVGGLSFKSNDSPESFTNRMRQVGNGFVAIEYLLNGKQYANLVFGDQAVYLVNTENGTGNPTSLGTTSNRWTTVYSTKLNNGADITVPTEGGTLARLEDLIDLRADINEADSELQSQITAQAGAIALLENGKLDRNLDPLNAGKYLIVGNDGNVELTTSGGGGGGGIGAVAHDETLTGAGTDSSPLGLAKAVKDEIADKAPKETVEALTQAVNATYGEIGTLNANLSQLESDLSKSIETESLTVGTDEGTLNLSITAGVATVATNNGLDIVARTKFDTAPTTDDNTTYANALDVSLMRKAQVATAIADAVSNIDALPEQTGNAGKVLMTDGTTASWQTPPASGTKITVIRYDE